ncbi:MAG: glycosyltransferase [Flavobacteriaceae bacterium]|nr:glycosyltransferase [Flavobacteriaceae bacterium]
MTIVTLAVLMLGVSFNFLEVSIMEARNFITAREMIDEGNWLLTTMNGEPRYQKPPLPTWITAIFMMVFGMKQVIFIRLPGIIMVSVIGLFIYFFSKRITGNSRGSLINALIALTSFYILAIVIEAPWDIYTHGFMCLGVFNIFMLLIKERGYWKHTLLAGLFIGASILSKGPISLYALLLPFLIAFGLSYRYRLLKVKLFSLFSVLIIALIIGGWWYLYVRIMDPESFQAMASKETTNWANYNVRPFYYYWSFFTQSGIWTIPAFMGLLYPYMKSRVSNLKAYKLTFYWTIIAVILLSVIPEKKSRYLMPVLIPLALNTGFYVNYMIKTYTSLPSKVEKVPMQLHFGLIAFICLAFPVGGYFFLKDNAAVNWVFFGFVSILMVVLGIFLIRSLIGRRMVDGLYWVVAFVLIAFLFISPMSGYLKSDNYRPISKLRSELQASNQNLYKSEGISPEMIWQFGDRIPAIDLSDMNRLADNAEFMLLTGVNNEESISFLNSRYDIEFIRTYDLNIVSEDSKSYKSRLRNSLYRLRKK